MDLRPLRRAGPAVALVAGSAGCAYGMPEPASEQGEHVRGLWSGMTTAALVVGLVVWLLIGWALVRYRQRRDFEGVANQRASHLPIEIAYSLVPVIIVVVLFVYTMRTDQEVRDLDPDPAQTVEVIGFQWGWEFRYPAHDLVVVGSPEDPDGPVLVLPVGETTRLELESVDVIHSFWVPRFLTKQDLFPGRSEDLDVTPTEKGRHVGRCAEYCGLDHWRMPFQVEVVSAAEFERWVAQQQGQQGS